MIAYLKGIVFEVGAESAVIDVQGVGYEILCSTGTLDETTSLRGKLTQFYVHTHVREDSLQLFGFLSQSEKNLFLALLRVNGIGPKVAIAALSGGSVSSIHQMIDREDVKSLSKLPKIGKKTAEQMILTLKGKLVLEERAEAPSRGKKKELVSALLNLGFRSSDIDKVVNNLAEEIELEEGLRQALASLTSV